MTEQAQQAMRALKYFPKKEETTSTSEMTSKLFMAAISQVSSVKYKYHCVAQKH